MLTVGEWEERQKIRKTAYKRGIVLGIIIGITIAISTVSIILPILMTF